MNDLESFFDGLVNPTPTELATRVRQWAQANEAKTEALQLEVRRLRAIVDVLVERLQNEGLLAEREMRKIRRTRHIGEDDETVPPVAGAPGSHPYRGGKPASPNACARCHRPMEAADVGGFVAGVGSVCGQCL
jgi:hypothetical protein